MNTPPTKNNESIPPKVKKLDANGNLDAITINALETLHLRKVSSAFSVHKLQTAPNTDPSIYVEPEDDADSAIQSSLIRKFKQVYSLTEIDDNTPLHLTPIRLNSFNAANLPNIVQTLKPITRATKIISQSTDALPAQEEESYQCKLCQELFNTGQALGGHMSRKHPGQSVDYIHKKEIRGRRDTERKKLYLAKIKFFEDLGYDYLKLKQSKEGKDVIKACLNRSKLKRLKQDITCDEVSNEIKSMEEDIR